MSEGMISLLISGTIDTIIMTFVSAILGFIMGVPTGVLLYVTRRGQVMENTVLYAVISAIVNIFRSIPFIILLVWISPFTKFLVGSAIGIEGAIVPLTVGAIPFIARMVS